MLSTKVGWVLKNVVTVNYGITDSRFKKRETRLIDFGALRVQPIERLKEFKAFTKANFVLTDVEEYELDGLTVSTFQKMRSDSPVIRQKGTSAFILQTPYQVEELSRVNNSLDVVLYSVGDFELKLTPIVVSPIMNDEVSKPVYYDHVTHEVLDPEIVLRFMRNLVNFSKTYPDWDGVDYGMVEKLSAPHFVVLNSLANSMFYPSIQVALSRIAPKPPVLIEAYAKFMDFFVDENTVFQMRPYVVQWNIS